MGLLDGTRDQKIRRLEQLLSPSQTTKPSKKAIDALRNSIKLDTAKLKKKKNSLKIKKA